MLADGRLGVLDFGAVNELPDGLPVEMGQLLTMALAGDSEGALEGLRQHGFVRANVDIDADVLLSFLEPFIGPLRTETFTFTRAWLRSVSLHLSDSRRPDFALGLKLNLPPSYLLIHRVWLGGIGVLCQIQGKVNGRAIVDRWLPEANLPPVIALGTV
jgi:predicted unusual protein kinase regulating ubiquinone biosynthesis (AarF/ABC1/UbiB family)